MSTKPDPAPAGDFGDGSGPPFSPDDVAAYVSDMAAQLSVMARKAGMPGVAADLDNAAQGAASANRK
ncbi:MAG: hypothetical protein AAGC56_15040 [Pseudomonadota bacterium]